MFSLCITYNHLFHCVYTHTPQYHQQCDVVAVGIIYLLLVPLLCPWLLSDQEGQSYYVPMYPFTRVKLQWAICSCTAIYFPYLSSICQQWWRSLNTWHVLAGFHFVVSSLGHELSLHLQERRKRCWSKWNTRNNWTTTETLPLKHSQQLNYHWNSSTVTLSTRKKETMLK